MLVRAVLLSIASTNFMSSRVEIKHSTARCVLDASAWVASCLHVLLRTFLSLVSMVAPRDEVIEISDSEDVAPAHPPTTQPRQPDREPPSMIFIDDSDSDDHIEILKECLPSLGGHSPGSRSPCTYIFCLVNHSVPMFATSAESSPTRATVLLCMVTASRGIRPFSDSATLP